MSHHGGLIDAHLAHHKRLLFREAVLVSILLVLALAMAANRAPGPVLAMDVLLILAGTGAAALAIVMRRGESRWWLLSYGLVAGLAGAAQLLWSFGTAVTLLLLLAVPFLADAAANIVILGLAILRRGKR